MARLTPAGRIYQRHLIRTLAEGNLMHWRGNPNDVDVGAETRLFRAARAAGMTRTEATQKRLQALDRYAKEFGLTSADVALLTGHIMTAAATVWPDQATTDVLRKLV